MEFVECWSELGELAVKALKPGGLLVAYTGQYTMPEALDRLRAAGLSWFWCHAVAHDGAFFTDCRCRLCCFHHGAVDRETSDSWRRSPFLHRGLVVCGAHQQVVDVALQPRHDGVQLTDQPGEGA